MDEKLLNYIKKHLEIGTDIQLVRQALLNAGYYIETVEEHINYAIQSKDEKLIAFIKKHIDLGTDIDKLKQVLVNAGYHAAVVEEHISNSIKTFKAKKRKKYILISSIATIALIISVVFANQFISSNKKIEYAGNTSNYTHQDENLGFLNEALIKKDVVICDMISDDNLKEVCQSKFLSNISVNVSACDEQCQNATLLNKAIIENNSSVCSDIGSEELRNKCISQFNRTAEKECDESCQYSRITNKALINQNASICYEISNETIMAQCKQYFNQTR